MTKLKILTNLTDFEADLNKIGWLGEKVAVLKKEFSNANNEGQAPTFKSLIFEFLILQFWNFLELRKFIKRDLSQLSDPKLQKVDEYLKPFWEHIEKYESALIELRNNYITHFQEGRKFKKMIENILIDTGFPTTVGDIEFMAGCIIIYKKYMITIFKNEYARAKKKYQAKRGIYPQQGVIKSESVNKLLKVKILEVNKELAKDGITYPEFTSNKS